MSGGIGLPMLSPLGSFGLGGFNEPAVSSALSTIGTGTSTGSLVAPQVPTTMYKGSGAGSGTNNAVDSQLGFNIPTANLALGGLSTLANIFMGMQALGQAKDQFDFTRRTTQVNLDNQTKSYNTNMEDKLTARANYFGQGRDYVDDYMSKNALAMPNVMGKR